MNKYRRFIFPALFVLLSACGGDDNTSTAASASTDRVSKYVGTWQGECLMSNFFVDVSGFEPSITHIVVRVTYSKVSDTEVNAQIEHLVYSGQDDNCSGPIQARLVRTGLNTGASTIDQASKTFTSSLGTNSRIYAGSASIPEAPGADNIFTVVAAPVPPNTGTVQIGPIEWNAGSQTGRTGFSAWYLDGNKLYFGQTVPYDPAKYPNTLGTAFYTKVQ